jgi:hypothetical protein
MSMGRSKNGTLIAAVVVSVSGLVLLPLWAIPAVAQGAPHSRTGASTKPAKHCHRGRKSACSGTQGTQSVTQTSGGLTVTFTATTVGANVTFDVESSETQAYGALGPEYLSFGNGASEGFATPEYCMAQPVAETNDRQISYSYGQPGSYTASVTVGANCTPDQLTLTLPITVS